MVVDDFPSLRKSPEDQCEQTVGRLSIGHGQMPCSAHEGGIRSDRLNAQAGELQVPHLLPFTLISLPIAIERALPAGGLTSSRKKSQIWRIPIPRHEASEVVVVPGILLSAEYPFDGGPHRLLRCFFGDTDTQSQHHDRDDHLYDVDAHRKPPNSPPVSHNKNCPKRSGRM